jgi:hypothetical protein
VIDFSLILPSRERLQLLENLLKSIEDTTSNINRIDTWIAFDLDDSESIKSMNRLSKRFSFVQFIVTNRQDNLSVGYYNRLAATCAGRFVQVLNDDCLFVTPSWDSLALEALESYQKKHRDGVLYGKVPDDLNCNYACFPLLSRQALNIVGWVFHPEMTAWGADQHLFDVYSRIDRVVNMPYSIEHLSHHTNKRTRDNVNQRLSKISRYNYASAPGEANRIRNILIDIAKNPPVLFA